MRKLITATAIAATVIVGGANIAGADPSFGPGNHGGGEGNSEPHDGKCHPPGQTEDVPGCK